MDLLIKRTLSLSIKLSEELFGLFSTDDNVTLYKTFTGTISFSMSTNVQRRSGKRGIQTITSQVTQGIP